VVCNSSGIYNLVWLSGTNCTGTPIVVGPTPLTPACSIYFSQSQLSFCPSVPTAPTGGGSSCFHRDTIIRYQNLEVTLKSLLDGSSNVPCVVPHHFSSLSGVKISTTCAGVLRLTPEHLVMTSSGWKMAGHLKVDDIIFSKLHNSETGKCQITQIEMETNQEYFGLNCEDSHVLADGYWVSTFGNYHNVPAFWMKYASRVIGIVHASKLGDFVAQFLASLHLL